MQTLLFIPMHTFIPTTLAHSHTILTRHTHHPPTTHTPHTPHIQEDINVTSEVGRQHILGQGLADKRELLRAWILRDHRPSGVSPSSSPSLLVSLLYEP